ncbi:UNVERIFIED_ORG: putative alpha/beta hydrolase family esterase [Kosakonia oryzae]|uniref:Alpha/beta hydrolase n=1 Tax=Kosakonia radicincitans TaxID=283686 RepID=A0AAX2EP89_9ENTR|nr:MULTISPECIES: alpha/beta hydrolase [Kosakonia]MDP9566880.1 putative alpha/beta hydrolase family esterase [Kosakonia oryzae]KDE38080.1 hypothetical protein AW40_00975 [Kosakonia radicincitans UMEnt01/12]MDD7998025.1 alpha/beta hydrolase [Kosakonia radicincitans]NCF06544.1 alpha/beta hydrolase [Kosakonia sp. MH5]PTA92483.1 alpha/beta hydrolase [Kosakonia sp. H7A]
MTIPRLLKLDDSFTTILVPGLRDSDDYHWQTCWARRLPRWKRISQRNWLQPDIENWGAAIRRELATCTLPVILIGHSFGALASWYQVQSRAVNVAGIVMVAPAEPSHFELEEVVTASKLKIPGMVFASHNDPLMSFNRAVFWSDSWGCELIDVGDAGHINSESGFGEWEYGLEKVSEFGEMLLKTDK